MYYNEDTYIKLNYVNPIYDNKFKKIKGIIEFNCKNDSEEEKVWLEVINRYSDGLEPFGVRLTNNIEQPIDTEKLKFASPKERAMLRARHQLTNRYLGMYAMGKEIPNYELMSLMDEALEAVTDSANKHELKNIEEELRIILPIITIELITSTYTIDYNSNEKLN